MDSLQGEEQSLLNMNKEIVREGPQQWGEGEGRRTWGWGVDSLQGDKQSPLNMNKEIVR